MKWLKEIDRILRGEATGAAALEQGKIDVSPGRLCLGLVGMGMLYGLCMASFSAFQGAPEWYLQMIATMLKVPALFLLTLLITFPSLYVFSALVGSRLRLLDLFRLLTAVLGVTMVVLASLGPIVAFFAMSTTNYHFMILLNVAVFAVAGTLGVLFLMQTLRRLSEYEARAAMPLVEVLDESAATPAPPPPPRSRPRREEVPTSMLGVRLGTVFRCWIILYGLVGAQMGWVLRPFVGYPGSEFSWFRPKQMNFFEAVLRNLKHLLS